MITLSLIKFKQIGDTDHVNNETLQQCWKVAMPVEACKLHKGSITHFYLYFDVEGKNMLAQNSKMQFPVGSIVFLKLLTIP